jgi:hypothetical protein
MRLKPKTKYTSRIIAAIFIVMTLFSERAPAADIQFNASLDRNIIALGQSTQLNLHFDGSSKVPAPDAPQVKGLQVRYVGPSTQMSIVNGRMSSSVNHIYRIVPTKTGKFTIGPLAVEYRGDRYSSNSLELEVLDSSSQRQGPGTEQNQPAVNLTDRVFIEMEIDKDRLYVNEIATLHIKLFVNSMKVRDVQYPRYSHEGFSVDEFEKPREYQLNRGGDIYSVLDFQTEIFATKEGRLSLGPAELKANIVTQSRRRSPSSRFDSFFGRDPFDDFFGNYETHPVELSADALSVNVLPLPAEGRPADFKGTIGSFQLHVSVSPNHVKVGDPVTLAMTVTGRGNLDAVHSPTLVNEEGFKIYDPQIRQEPNSKVFEQVLIPADEKINSTPDISLSFFDSAKGRYITLVRKGVPLQVMKAERKEEITILDAANVAERPLKKESIGRDIIYIKESPGRIVKKDDYLHTNPLFLMLQAVPLLLFAALWFYRKKQELSAPKKAKKGIQQAEHYLRKKSTGEFYDAVFKTLRDYLGNRFHVPSGGITGDSLDSIIKGEHIDSEITERLKNIFQECDMVRYAPAEFNTARMEETLTEMRELIDYLERHKI